MQQQQKKVYNQITLTCFASTTALILLSAFTTGNFLGLRIVSTYCKSTTFFCKRTTFSSKWTNLAVGATLIFSANFSSIFGVNITPRGILWDDGGLVAAFCTSKKHNDRKNIADMQNNTGRFFIFKLDNFMYRLFTLIPVHMWLSSVT